MQKKSRGLEKSEVWNGRSLIVPLKWVMVLNLGHTLPFITKFKLRNLSTPRVSPGSAVGFPICGVLDSGL